MAIDMSKTDYKAKTKGDLKFLGLMIAQKMIRIDQIS